MTDTAPIASCTTTAGTPTGCSSALAGVSGTGAKSSAHGLAVTATLDRNEAVVRQELPEPLHYSTGPGVPGYAERDRGLDRDTHDGHRLDYLFGTAPTPGCSVTDTAYSDHHVLVHHVDVT